MANIATPVRPTYLVASAFAASLIILAARSASAGAQAAGLLRLQTATPGTPQTGNANLTGTSIAGQFQGGGAGLTALNANNIASGTLSAARLPVPIHLTGLGLGGIFWGTNTSTSGFGVFGESNSATGVTYGVRGDSDSTSGTGVWGLATATSGTTNGVWGRTASSSGTGVLGSATSSSGTTYGVFGTSAGFNGYGVYGEATSSTGSNYGGRFQNQSNSGAGLYGAATSTTGSTFGGRFENNSSSGRGVFGWTLATSGTTYGVWGRSDSTAGYGVFGESSAPSGTGFGGYFTSVNGIGVHGEGDHFGGVEGITNGTGAAGVTGKATATTGYSIGGSFTSSGDNGIGVSAAVGSSTGPTIGVYARTLSPDGIGVQGLATAEAGGIGVYGQTTSLSSSGVGGYFDSKGAAGIGVYGKCGSSINTTYGGRFEAGSDNARGVFGWAYGTTAGSSIYGVRGQASTATAGYGVYAVGDMGASGVKPFRIDHPSDPLNKYLLHYSSESPFPQNFYNGNAVTDARGYAWIELPEYFEDINTNFKYILTVVDDADQKDFVQVKVSKKIRGNRFQVRTSAPNVEVSWEVKADRNDKRIQFNRPTDVRDKTGLEKGKYQHPEYYGAPVEMGMDYQSSAKGKRD